MKSTLKPTSVFARHSVAPFRAVLRSWEEAQKIIFARESSENLGATKTDQCWWIQVLDYSIDDDYFSIVYIYMYYSTWLFIYLVGGLEHFVFPYIGKNNPKWLIFFRGVETTNQIYYCTIHWWWILIALVVNENTI